MDLAANTVLITGGASGIGLALAERFLEAGSQVIVCGRREDKLREAQARHPGLAVRVCDVARDSERVALFRWAVAEFPRLNVRQHCRHPMSAAARRTRGVGSGATGDRHQL